MAMDSFQNHPRGAAAEIKIVPGVVPVVQAEPAVENNQAKGGVKVRQGCDSGQAYHALMILLLIIIVNQECGMFRTRLGLATFPFGVNI